MANFDEVYYCKQCRRQQTVSQGIKCKVCRQTTVSWNLTTQAEKPAIKSWEFVHPTNKKPKR